MQIHELANSHPCDLNVSKSNKTFKVITAEGKGESDKMEPSV